MEPNSSIRRESNLVADALSRVPSNRVERESVERPLDSNSNAHCMFREDPELADCLFYEPEIAECFLEHPVFDDEGRVPFNFKTLEECQLKCPDLQSMPLVFPDRFYKVMFNDTELICFHQNGADRIVLTQELLPKIVKYYHESMAHTEGAGRLSQGLKQHCYHRDVDRAVKQHIEQCPTCDLNKRGGRIHGESAPRDASATPWGKKHIATPLDHGRLN